MSQEIFHEIDNRVDKEKSEYYYYNKRKRHFWHSKSVTISCRVRDKNEFNRAREMAINIRAFLLNCDQKFKEAVWIVRDSIYKKDSETLRNYVISRFGYDGLGNKVSNFDEVEKNVGLLIRSLSEEEVRNALNLEHVVSCRLLGYEKEFFFLKCYSIGIWPSYLLRCLYHTEYAHYDLENISDDDLPDEKVDTNPYFKKIDYVENGLNNPYKGLEFSYYLDQIKFL